ncbi:porin [Polymorphobacter sp.]|uniref:porin n=1 Tax=Polymorphobacter sp. TaxID=1909290 RepID=UPI003F6E9E28
MAPGFRYLASATLLLASPAQAQTVEELQRQIDELKAMVAELRAERQQALQAAPPAHPAPAAAPQVAAAPAPPPVRTVKTIETADTAPIVRSKRWFERLSLRGYTQLRVNEIVSGDATAPPGQSRLRSVADGGITDENNFSFRRVRLVLEGDITDNISLYFQPDFATSVSGQSAGERREGFGQLRDAYVDVFLDADKRFRVRFGQSKVPFGWENLQSSSNRAPLDRSDAVNSGVIGERDLGVVAYYTPAPVQRIWDRLEADGQKLFGNYGAFGVGLYNGQGTNRTEANNNLMTVAMATWPFEIGDQVVEVGGSVMFNRFQPETRTGLSPLSYKDNRAVVHAILYPQPFGVQAEWTWGTGPEFDTATRSIQEKPLQGGYVQAMLRVRQSPLGPFMPYARWQHFRGGWKAAINTPRLETDDLELGIEFQPMSALELTLSYARASRREADERRSGRAEGDLLRAQLQWNY